MESDLLDFARLNPGTVVYLKPRRHRSPVLVAEYLNGQREHMSCHNFTREEVLKWVEYLRTRSGEPVERLRRFQHTDYPSIQGVWTPFTNASPHNNVTQFPDVSFIGKFGSLAFGNGKRKEHNLVYCSSMHQEEHMNYVIFKIHQQILIKHLIKGNECGKKLW